MTTDTKPTSLPKNHKLIKKIGLRISTIREIRGISKSKLAELARISLGDLEKYEAGEKAIKADDLATIADILEIGAFHFFL